MNFISMPTTALPTLPAWTDPLLTPLASPSRTAAALSRAHSWLQTDLAIQTQRVHDHVTDLTRFAAAVRDVDTAHAQTFRGQ